MTLRELLDVTTNMSLVLVYGVSADEEADSDTRLVGIRVPTKTGGGRLKGEELAGYMSEQVLRIAPAQDDMRAELLVYMRLKEEVDEEEVDEDE